MSGRRPGPGVLVSLVAVVAVATTARGYADTWLATHWLFTYGDGLVRRGLVGTLVAPLAGTPVTLELLTVLGLVPLVLVAAGLVKLVVDALRVDPSPATWALAAALLVTPAGLRFLAFELGRFDTINLVLVLGVLALLPRLGVWAGAGLVAGVGALGVAVHESFLFVHLPLLLAAAVTLWWRDAGTGRRSPTWRDGVPVVAAVLPALAVMAWVSTAPYLTEPEVASTLAALSRDATFLPDEDSLRIHARALPEVLAYTYGGLAGAGPVRVLLLFTTIVLACVPAAVIAGRALRVRAAALGAATLDRVGGSARVLTLGALGPLLMVPIAIDWGRWAALAAINLAVAALWATRVAGAPSPRAVPAGRTDGPRVRDPGQVPVVVWVVLLLSALLPPIGPTGGFEPTDLVGGLVDLATAVRYVLGG